MPPPRGLVDWISGFACGLAPDLHALRLSASAYLVETYRTDHPQLPARLRDIQNSQKAMDLKKVKKAL